MRVLVAEDDLHDQMLFVMAANDADVNLSIDFAADGQEVLDLLREKADDGSLPDLVILDLRMPRLDGHEVLEALQADTTICPPMVGVFSSSYRQLDIDRSLDAGAQWHEVKPSRYEELVEFVKRITI